MSVAGGRGLENRQKERRQDRRIERGTWRDEKRVRG